MNVRCPKYGVLLLLALLFIAPGVMAYLFYTHPQWLTTVRTNKGQFLTPPLPWAGGPHHSTKWQLILWSPSRCDTACLHTLDQLARVRLALGRHLYEVELRLVLPQNAPPLSFETRAILQEHTIFISRWASTSTVLPLDSRIFIANKDGYLVLVYPATISPRDVFHDIKQLLNTASRVRK